MPGKIPNPLYLFRIVHIDNVEYLLQYGMFNSQHTMADPNYINIGDSGLITQRSTYPVPIKPPNGVLGDYIPFYFGPLSPMLLNIKTGHRGIKYRPQTDIVYICCNITDIIQNCPDWCFTDGHAKNAITSFFNTTTDLSKVDWNVVDERYWQNTEEDFDKMRRKQAEFLVKNCVPTNCINCIVVVNQQICTLVEQIIGKLGLKIRVLVNPNNQFYY